jgi:hypothetical protein
MSQGIILESGHPETPGVGAGFVYKGTVTCDACPKKFNIYHHIAHPEDDVKQSEWLQAQLAKDHKDGKDHADSFQYPW